MHEVSDANFEEWKLFFANYFSEAPANDDNEAKTAENHDSRKMAHPKCAGVKKINGVHTPHSPALLRCRWQRCRFVTKVAAIFYDHVTDKHLNSQNKGGSENAASPFTCRWNKCRLLRSEIPSFERLCKHVRTSHTKEKSHRCRIDQCTFETNFPQQLVKHMDSHDKTAGKNAYRNYCNNQTAAAGANKSEGFSSPAERTTLSPPSESLKPGTFSIDSAPSLSRQSSRISEVSSRRVKYPPVKNIIRDSSNQECCDNQQDIDSTLECLREMSQTIHSQLDIDPEGHAHCIRLRGDVIGCRTTRINGVNSKQLLIKWKPHGILGDEWMPFESVQQMSRIIPIEQVPRSFWLKKFPVLFPQKKSLKNRRKK